MASTKTAGPDGAAFRNDADAVALSLVACVAAGRARGAKAGKALQNSPLPSGVLCPARLLLDSRYIRPIRTRMTTMIRMMPSHRRDNSPSRLNKAMSEQRINGAHETILKPYRPCAAIARRSARSRYQRPSTDHSSIVAAVRLLTATLYPVNIRPLLRFGFAAVDGFLGHVAGIVMILPRLLFARSLLVWILVVGHRILL